jgi:uncharacterized protein (TIGR03435 family)
MSSAARTRRSLPSILTAAMVTALSASAGPLSSQSTGTEADIHFDVASIRISPTGRGGPTSTTIDTGGRYTAINVPVRTLIGQAYDVRNVELPSGAAWIQQQRFDIAAKATGELVERDGRRPLQAALRGLLATRFKLVGHTELRERPMYALVPARPDRRLGPHLRRSKRTGCDSVTRAARGRSEPQPLPPPTGAGAPPCGSRRLPSQWIADAVPLSTLVSMISVELSRQVVDRTGLTGRFDVRLTFMPERPLALTFVSGEQFPPPDPDAPLLATAVREQLGLRLEPGTGLMDVLVIDSVDRPDQD